MTSRQEMPAHLLRRVAVGIWCSVAALSGRHTSGEVRAAAAVAPRSAVRSPWPSIYANPHHTGVSTFPGARRGRLRWRARWSLLVRQDLSRALRFRSQLYEGALTVGVTGDIHVVFGGTEGGWVFSRHGTLLRKAHTSARLAPTILPNGDQVGRNAVPIPNARTSMAPHVTCWKSDGRKRWSWAASPLHLGGVVQLLSSGALVCVDEEDLLVFPQGSREPIVIEFPSMLGKFSATPVVDRDSTLILWSRFAGPLRLSLPRVLRRRLRRRPGQAPFWPAKLVERSDWGWDGSPDAAGPGVGMTHMVSGTHGALYIPMKARTLPFSLPELQVREGLQQHRWSRQAPEYTFAAPPAVTETGTVYYPDRDGSLCALRAADGSVLWRVTEPEGGELTVPCVDAEGRAYSVDQKHSRLLALSSTGTVLWRFPFQERVFSRPIIGPDQSVVVVTTEALYCIE